MLNKKEKSLFTLFLEKNFPGIPGNQFPEKLRSQAGKSFKKGKLEDAVKLLTGKNQERPGNFQPPAKCNILAKSRSFNEWPISIVSKNIQTYIYNLTKTECEPSRPLLTKESRDDWFEKSKIDNIGYTSSQGLNSIFTHAYNRFAGVITKVDNRNKKRQEKYNRTGHKFEIEIATNEFDKLLQPPGINNNIYCYNVVSPRPVHPIKDAALIARFPVELQAYNLDPDKPLPSINNRLSIPKGKPGYIPTWQRKSVTSKRKRIHNYDSKPILFVIKIQEDFLIFDARGLLRNVRLRNLDADARKPLTPNDLCKLFTGDPVIDPNCNIITCCYKPEVINIHSEITIKGKRTKTIIETLTTKENVGLITIDLGVNHPQATRMFRISNKNGNLMPEYLKKSFLPKDILFEIDSIKKAHDKLEEDIVAQATLSLTNIQQNEITKINEVSPKQVLNKICETYQINPNELNLDGMIAKYTNFIADHVIKIRGDNECLWFDKHSPKGSKKKTITKSKKSDSKFAYEFKPKLSTETNNAKFSAIWDIKRNSLEYAKFSKRKTELARRIVNLTIKEAREITGCKEIVVSVEDLIMDNKLFSGNGKREPGWNNFFIPKKENRWYMQCLHKAYTDLAKHRGMYICEVRPERTSITCIDCGHCDKENRNGEKFVCKKCKAEYHADIDIGCTNIMKVTLTGQSMPKSASEKVIVKSRKALAKDNSLKSKLILGKTSTLSGAVKEVPCTARKASYN